MTNITHLGQIVNQEIPGQLAERKTWGTTSFFNSNSAYLFLLCHSNFILYAINRTSRDFISEKMWFTIVIYLLLLLSVSKQESISGESDDSTPRSVEDVAHAFLTSSLGTTLFISLLIMMELFPDQTLRKWHISF